MATSSKQPAPRNYAIWAVGIAFVASIIGGVLAVTNADRGVFSGEAPRGWWQIFDTRGFVPRASCGPWTPTLLFLAKASELGLWIFYEAVIAFVLMFVAPRHLPRFQQWFQVLGILFLTCAGTHYMGWLMFYWPAYRFDTYFRVFACLVGFVGLYTLIPRALETRSFPPMSGSKEKLFLLREEVMGLQNDLASLQRTHPVLLERELHRVVQLTAQIKENRGQLKVEQGRYDTPR